MAQINHSTGNNQFSQEYMPFIVRWGRITNLLGVVLCFLPPLVLTFGFGFNPGLTAIITGALAQVSGSCIFWFVEPISYFPVLGIPGTYMSFLAGNGSSLRLPCSAAAQEAADVQPGTDKGTIISTLGITVSIFINIGMLLLGVILGASVLGALQPDSARALWRYVCPVCRDTAQNRRDRHCSGLGNDIFGEQRFPGFFPRPARLHYHHCIRIRYHRSVQAAV